MTCSLPTRGDYNRRMRKSVIILAAALCLTAACSTAKPGDEFGMKDQAAIRERTDAFVKAFNARELDQILAIYAENSVFMPPNQPIIRGRDALRTFYDDMLKAGASGLKLDVGEVSGHGPLAYESGTYEMDYRPASGSGTHDRGKYLFVLRRLNDTWRYEYTVWNSDLPSARD
jgi:ketosteroid isomerase-like protein